MAYATIPMTANYGNIKLAIEILMPKALYILLQPAISTKSTIQFFHNMHFIYFTYTWAIYINVTDKNISHTNQPPTHPQNHTHAFHTIDLLYS